MKSFLVVITPIMLSPGLDQSASLLESKIASVVIATGNGWRLMGGRLDGAQGDEVTHPFLCPLPDDKSGHAHKNLVPPVWSLG